MRKTPGQENDMGRTPCQPQVSHSGPILRASTVSFKPPVGATMGKVPKRMASICTKPQGSHLLKLWKALTELKLNLHLRYLLIFIKLHCVQSIEVFYHQEKTDVMKKFLMTPARFTWNRWRNRCHMEPHLLTMNDAPDVLCCFSRFLHVSYYG